MSEETSPMQRNSCAVPIGVPLEQITDVIELRGLVGFLYDRLDDIDTEDDICKSNDKRYRDRVRDHQQKRLVRIRSDGYNLFVTPVAEVPIPQ